MLGLVIGSFLNVVVHRVPRGESVVSPPSACPRCGTPIRTRHNVPVLGWLVLRGRCYDCRLADQPALPAGGGGHRAALRAGRLAVRGPPVAAVGVPGVRGRGRRPGPHRPRRPPAAERDRAAGVPGPRRAPAARRRRRGPAAGGGGGGPALRAVPPDRPGGARVDGVRGREARRRGRRDDRLPLVGRVPGRGVRRLPARGRGRAAPDRRAAGRAPDRRAVRPVHAGRELGLDPGRERAHVQRSYLERIGA